MIELQDLLEGERMEHDNLRVFAKQSNWERLMELEKSDAIIKKSGPRALTLYGTESQVSSAKIAINRLNTT